MEKVGAETFETLVKLIKEVKPGLGGRTISVEDSVIEHLGLDSLDMLQLSRRISRAMGVRFDLDSWSKEAGTHKSSVQSLLNAIDGVKVT